MTRKLVIQMLLTKADRIAIGMIPTCILTVQSKWVTAFKTRVPLPNLQLLLGRKGSGSLVANAGLDGRPPNPQREAKGRPSPSNVSGGAPCDAAGEASRPRHSESTLEPAEPRHSTDEAPRQSAEAPSHYTEAPRYSGTEAPCNSTATPRHYTAPGSRHSESVTSRGLAEGGAARIGGRHAPGGDTGQRAGGAAGAGGRVLGPAASEGGRRSVYATRGTPRRRGPARGRK